MPRSAPVGLLRGFRFGPFGCGGFVP
eukprot:COSAG01_NODE_47098_length_393_cov_2.462585_1_plen_25_part_10